MEQVNSFVMSWWPVFAGIFAVLVLLAQLWNSGLRGEMQALHERASTQEAHIKRLEEELHRFELHATERFVTGLEIERIIATVESLKTDIKEWLNRVEQRLDQKVDK